MGCESLAVEYLAAGLQRAGHRVALCHDPALFQDKLVFQESKLGRLLDRREALVAEALEWRPDLLAFSVMTDTYQWALSLAGAIKVRRDVPVLFGGVHPTSLPERVMAQPMVDMICVGEGDEAVVEFADTLESGGDASTIANIWSRRPDGEIVRNPPRALCQDLSSLPWPAKDLYAGHADMRNQYLIVAGRGCCFQCSFCSQSMLNQVYEGSSRRIRLREPEEVIEELCWAKERYGVRAVAFMDNVFGHKRRWLEQLAGMYMDRVRLPFRCQGHVSILDEGRARLLKEMGCRRIKFGIQTRNEQIRREVFDRRETNAQMERTLEICDRVRLPYYVDHIFTPFDGDEDHREAAEYYASKRSLNKVFVYSLSFFPSTPIFEHMLSEGLIDEETAEDVKEGRGQAYTSAGEDAAAHRAFRTYGVLYRLVPVLNRRAVRSVLRHRGERLLERVPPLAHHLVDISVALLRRDPEYLQFGVSLARTYLLNLLRPPHLVELPRPPARGRPPAA